MYVGSRCGFFKRNKFDRIQHISTRVILKYSQTFLWTVGWQKGTTIVN